MDDYKYFTSKYYEYYQEFSRKDRDKGIIKFNNDVKLIFIEFDKIKDIITNYSTQYSTFNIINTRDRIINTFTEDKEQIYNLLETITESIDNFILDLETMKRSEDKLIEKKITLETEETNNDNKAILQSEISELITIINEKRKRTDSNIEKIEKLKRKISKSNQIIKITNKILEINTLNLEENLIYLDKILSNYTQVIRPLNKFYMKIYGESFIFEELEFERINILFEAFNIYNKAKVLKEDLIIKIENSIVIFDIDLLHKLIDFCNNNYMFEKIKNYIIEKNKEEYLLMDDNFIEYEGIKYSSSNFIKNIDLFRKTISIPSSSIKNILIDEFIKRGKNSESDINSLIKICQNNQKLENLINEETGFTIEKYASYYENNLTAKLSKTISEMATEIETKTRKIETKISSIMKSLQEEDVKLAGFENRFKSTENIALNLTKVINEFPNITIEQAIASISDGLRYTLVLTKEKYKDQVISKIQILKNLGYEIIHLKNAWGNQLYQGLNVSFATEDNVHFEVQFHTENSYMVKERINHIYYEISRNNNASQEARYLASEIMKETQSLFVETINDAIWIDVSYINNSMQKYKIYTDYENFKNIYQASSQSWYQNNPTASKIVKSYIEGQFENIGSYCTMNSILRGMFRANDNINISKITDNKTVTYTKEEFSRIVNMSIEEYELKTIQAAEELNNAISSMGLKENTVMYRGINNNALKKYEIDIENDTAEEIYKKLTKEGKFYIDRGFMSATPILKGMIESKDIILIMNCKENTKGIDLSPLKHDEAEFLFPANSSFHIDTVTKEGGKTYIHVSSL